jgi:hypothetical protein
MDSKLRRRKSLHQHSHCIDDGSAKKDMAVITDRGKPASGTYWNNGSNFNKYWFREHWIRHWQYVDESSAL